MDFDGFGIIFGCFFVMILFVVVIFDVYIKFKVMFMEMLCVDMNGIFGRIFMLSYFVFVDDVFFLLKDVFGYECYFNLLGFVDVLLDFVEVILWEGGKFVKEIL